MTETLLVDVRDGVALVTLNRPQARNALSPDLAHGLSSALRRLDADNAVRVIVLTGADPAFCAGLDLKSLAADGPAYLEAIRESNCIRLVGELATPVIGAVNGAAFTGGFEIALGCDFLIASDRANFADTHARVGVLPGGGMTVRLPDRVGPGWARRMSFTGDVVDADLALRIGLVTEVVAHDDLVGRALEVARRIADTDGQMLRSVKQIYDAGWDATTGPALAVEGEMATATTPDWDALESNRRNVMASNRAQL
ncbi:enoyl-CoA hydratase [Gordonia sp. HNM0687]|uniref:Enoyl-CoA hydratase n=1 Tax=Gordonia mangrovi TaxID=2665643 RepID=A0A6L7GK27_9ACTN|nr:enoyl-CoA hydratase [Gordonia mangrovi]MXP19803.1 enoyl-CoA hydratase [Gordonia mangrovi]UVF79570.1 enoyl-CoA hydratase [Gordonia mangrovi]